MAEMIAMPALNRKQKLNVTALTVLLSLSRGVLPHHQSDCSAVVPLQ